MDLARSPDGSWWVIADRTQAPSGIGYALENRLVSARTLPAVFSQCHVRQLTRFFDVKRDALLALALSRRDNPRVVLLTPGPHNETYFEHSFLARPLGLHAGRRRRPDGARQPRLSEDAGRAWSRST